MCAAVAIPSGFNDLRRLALVHLLFFGEFRLHRTSQDFGKFPFNPATVEEELVSVCRIHVGEPDPVFASNFGVLNVLGSPCGKEERADDDSSNRAI